MRFIWTLAAVAALGSFAAGQAEQVEIRDRVPVYEAKDSNIAINVNGRRVFTHLANPIIVDGRVLVPVRNVFEELDIVVDWNPEFRMVTAQKNDRVLTLRIGDRHGLMGGQVLPMDVPAIILNGRTMVPLRFVAESLDAYVMWDEARRTVVVTTKIDSPVDG
jgi:hypothetical protein